MDQELSQLLQRHKSELSKLITVELASTKPSQKSAKNNDKTSSPIHEQQDEKLLRRFQSIGIDGEGQFSSSSYSTHEAVSKIHLNPIERMSIHELVYGSMITGNNTTEEDDEDESFINERLSSNTTLKVLTIISFLCQEAYELEDIAMSSIIKGIILFGTNPLIPKISTPSKISDKSEMSEEELDGLVARMSQEVRDKREIELIYYMGKYLFFLQGVCNFTIRCQRLIRNIVCQLAAIVVMNDESTTYDNGEDGDYSSTSTMNATPLIEALGTLLRILILIDLGISSNKDLLEAWELYKNAFKKKWRDNNTCKCNKEYEPLERLLLQLDISLLASCSFLTAIEQNLDPTSNTNENNEMPQYRTNTTLHEEMKSYIFYFYHKYSSKITTSISSTLMENGNSKVGHDDYTLTSERIDMINVYGLYALYRKLIPQYVKPDASMHKLLSIDFPKNICPLIAISSTNIAFCPKSFLSKYAPLQPSSDTTNDLSSLNISSDVTNHVILLDNSLPTLASNYQQQTLQWILRVDSDFAPLPPTIKANINLNKISKTMRRKTILLLKGLLLAYNISNLLQSFLSYHKQYKIPMDISKLPYMYKLIICLKSIEKTVLSRRYGAIVSMFQPMTRCLACDIFECFDKLRSFIDHSTTSNANGIVSGEDSTNVASRKKKKRLHMLACCLNVLEGILMGSATYTHSRRNLISVIASLCTDKNINEATTTTPNNMFLSKDDAATVHTLLKRLHFIVDYNTQIQKACDCSFLYFHKELLSSLIQTVLWNNSDKHMSGGDWSLQLLLSAFSFDPERLLKCTPHIDCNDYYGGSNAYVKSYQLYIQDVIQKEILDRVCQDIEIDLRVLSLTKHMTDLPSVNPKQQPNSKLKYLLCMPPLHLGNDIVINVKRIVQLYLEKNIYDLAIIDADKVGNHLYMMQMKILAKQKYDIVLMDNHLPLNSLELSSLDVCDVMANNMEEFLQNFNYNFNQTFVERRPHRGSKYLRTLCIASVVKCITKNGFGVFHEAMNILSTHLSKKLLALSSILMNDYLRSRLSKEVRWFHSYISSSDAGINKNSNRSTNKSGDQMKSYPYNRAVQFRTETNNSPLLFGNNTVEDLNSSFLDETKRIITEIGNLVGFVKLFCSAANHFRSDVLHSCFPNKEDSNLENHLQNDNYTNSINSSSNGSDEISRAVNNWNELLRMVSDGQKNKGIATYFKQFLDKFYETNLHIITSMQENLKYMYIIIPTTSLSWIEANITAKEMIYKKNRTLDAYFSNDGYSLGTAFLLFILKQFHQFESLNWSTSLSMKYQYDDQALRNQILTYKAKKSSKYFGYFTSASLANKSSIDEILSNDISDESKSFRAMNKRLNTYQREIDLFFYSLNGSRTFFNSFDS